ncbi:hypothetical protein SARI_03903 [Salmonella enterica subsp. arizonae serovar 62:z4,z23:-]|uniref:Uncharacterized protein n=1 Tax=Salmonella arizonae (strain ATCC BAA-731 / CDC346-86 / RSK2980) TaxID=41514 RepID=A9MKM8_SALAR|nr:hypothetical protein SARI_03903 [Salmonella enterica subsp. arizonae serovar 62:z4,z23:-]
MIFYDKYQYIVFHFCSFIYKIFSIFELDKLCERRPGRAAGSSLHYGCCAVSCVMKR